MIENIIGKRYAEALSNSIGEGPRVETALNNLKALLGAFTTEPKIGVFFSHPTIPLVNKKLLVNELCERVKAELEVQNLMTVLVERGKVLNLKTVTEYFQSAVDERLNRSRASVVAARPLDEAQLQRFRDSLKNILRKEVLIETSVDESLLGGIVLRLGSLVADASVKNRLANMKRFIEKEEVV